MWPIGVGVQLSGRRSDRSEFPIDISLGSLGPDGRRLVMATVRADIGERLRIETAVRELEA